MNLRDVMDFDTFCGLYSCQYTSVYEDKEKRVHTYHPYRMNEEVLTHIYAEFCSKSLDIRLLIDSNSPDGHAHLILDYYIEGSTSKEECRQLSNLRPKYEDILNSNLPVVITNMYKISGVEDDINVELLTVLLTNNFRTLSSISFKNEVGTVVDANHITKEQWEHLIAWQINSINYKPDRIEIDLNQPIISLLGR